MSITETTEVFFVVDGATLEAQACILAPSLKRNLRPNQRAIAYVRQDYRPNLHAMTLETLAACHIEIRDIPGTNGTHAPWMAPYPQGNKILAAAAPRDCDVSVFLDTDTVLIESLDFAAELGDAMMAACVSDYLSAAGSEEDWAEYYATFDLPMPTERVQLVAGRRLTSLPYFNAGVILFRERLHDGLPTHIGRDWLENALKFEREIKTGYNRANIDQFTLPILGYLRGTPVKQLGQHMNFNIQAHGEAPGERQSIIHYHRLGVLWAHGHAGRVALENLAEDRGQAVLEQYIDAFGSHVKRKRMKPHLAAMAADASGAASGSPDADPQE